MDLEPVCVVARENVVTYGLEDRITTAAADMFQDSWPTGHDAVLFGNIFHDWDVDTCKLLAHQAFDVLEPGGSIFLHEMPLNKTKDGPLIPIQFLYMSTYHQRSPSPPLYVNYSSTSPSPHVPIPFAKRPLLPDCCKKAKKILTNPKLYFRFGL